MAVVSDTGMPYRPWQALGRDVATTLRARLEDIVVTVTRDVSLSSPVFAGLSTPKFKRDVDTAVRAANERFLDLIGTDEPALPPAVEETFVALGAAEAREDRSPDVLHAALRTAGRTLLRTASEALGSVRPVDTAELLDLADAVTAFVDTLVAACTDGYARQVHEQAGETDRRRHVLGQLLLQGNAAAGSVTTAATAVGWRRLDEVVAVLLPAEYSRDARFRYGPDGIVVDREQDAVLLVRRGPRTTRAAFLDALRDRPAVIGPALPWPRVPDGVRLAEMTAQIVSSAAEGALFVEDHLATLALHGEQDALDVLAERRLAAFDGLRDSSRHRLLETLQSWLMHWGSRSEVAADLFIHPQTVSYRVRRLREILGDDLDDAAARFELMLALGARGLAGSSPEPRDRSHPAAAQPDAVVVPSSPRSGRGPVLPG